MTRNRSGPSRLVVIAIDWACCQRAVTVWRRIALRLRACEASVVGIKLRSPRPATKPETRCASERYAARMRLALCSFCLALATVSLGCSPPRPPAAALNNNRAIDERPDAAAAVPEPSLTVGRARWSGPCATIVSRMRAVLARLPSACAADADCTCYPGGIEAVTGCGAVSDMATAREVTQIQADFRANRCDYSVSCAPRECRAACVQGRC
jgi:hypothetical protein